jgi:hypothetical protein
MNPFEFVLGLILILTIGGVVKMVLKNGRVRGDAAPETERLRSEVETLRARMAVLERITVEKENSLEREIEQLRDR